MPLTIQAIIHWESEDPLENATEIHWERPLTSAIISEVSFSGVQSVAPAGGLREVHGRLRGEAHDRLQGFKHQNDTGEPEIITLLIPKTMNPVM